MDSRIVLPNGSVKHVHTVGHPVFNESGELTEFIGVVMDTTERKRSEEALRRRKRNWPALRGRRRWAN